MRPFLRFASVFLTFSSCLLGVEPNRSKNGGMGEKTTGDWFGARTTLEDRGIDFSGHWSSVYAGVVSVVQHRGTFVEQVNFELELDFASSPDGSRWRVSRFRPACAGATASSLIHSSGRPVCSAR